LEETQIHTILFGFVLDEDGSGQQIEAEPLQGLFHPGFTQNPRAMTTVYIDFSVVGSVPS
jgi:hypothetical protein